MSDTLLTQVEFSGDDVATAEQLARRLGYTQTAYTSTSALVGLFCMRERASQHAGCVIKTRELGFLFVQDLEDVNAYDLIETLEAKRKASRPAAKKDTQS